MGSGRRRKKAKRKANKNNDAAAKEDAEGVPRSIVFRRGKVGFYIHELVDNMRTVMAPNTALKLKETKNNVLKDFVSVAPALKVTHLLAFSQSATGTHLRILRLPQGPTLTFQVLNYSLVKDVVKNQKKPHSPGNEFLHSPLVVLNGFGGKDEDKAIMSAMLTNMFPAIDVQNIKLSECRRVLLMNMDPKTREIELRHYVVNASPVGLTKSVKKIIKGETPNLHGVKDIADWIENPGNLSDSEVEDTPETRITLSQNFAGRGNKATHKSAIRLKELGPRLTLKLLKIESEINGGRVLYHALKTKTKEEEEALKKRKKERERAKAQRKKQQQINVENKLKRQREEDSDDDGYAGHVDDADVEDDDAAWYRKEVGEEPESDMFQRVDRRKKKQKEVVMKCNICDKPGHKAKECPKKPKSESKKKREKKAFVYRSALTGSIKKKPSGKRRK